MGTFSTCDVDGVRSSEATETHHDNKTATKNLSSNVISCICVQLYF